MRDHDGTRHAVMIDAIVVVPGIMGTRLVEAQTKDPLWDVTRLVQLKTIGHLREGWAASRLAPLMVTEQERAGHSDRVEPAGLIKEPVWGPTLRLNFGYRRLTNSLRNVVAHPDALLEFGYDWRLDVRHNGALLAKAIDNHLTAWRGHRAVADWRAARRSAAEPRVVIVAHSMGGLVTQAAGLQRGALDDVRMVITIGTPFRGAVDAVTMLNSGRSKVGLPEAPTADLARTLPGLHDLLPTYRCMLTADDLVALDARTVAAFGGDADLARESFDRLEQVRAVELPGLVNLAGSHQPTDITFRHEAGVVHTARHGYARDAADRLVRNDGQLVPLRLHGDGTVQWQSARLGEATGYDQKHGALQATMSVVRNIEAQIEGPPLGDGLAGRQRLGVDLPEYAPVGSVVSARVTGAAGAPSAVVRGLDGGFVRDATIRRDGEDYLVAFPVEEPGVHVLAVSGGVEPVLDAVLVQDSAQPHDWGARS